MPVLKRKSWIVATIIQMHASAKVHQSGFWRVNVQYLFSTSYFYPDLQTPPFQCLSTLFTRQQRKLILLKPPMELRLAQLQQGRSVQSRMCIYYLSKISWHYSLCWRRKFSEMVLSCKIVTNRSHARLSIA